MLQKLDKNKISEILEAGIHEFASRGFERARMSEIAKSAGVSVGVLYKYYDNKDALFLECVRHALTALDEALGEAFEGDFGVAVRAERLARALIRSARKNPDHHILYHEITAGGCKRFAPQLARTIEGVTSRVYTQMIENAQRDSAVRGDIDARYLAFFFDNLLMMVPFSLTCDYYKERLSLYCGERQDDERLVNELTRFIVSACMPPIAAEN